METVLSNFVEETDVILVGIIGEMGKQATSIAKRIGAKVHILEAHDGQILEYNVIDSHLAMLRPKVFFIVHGENSTGVLQPIDNLGELCRK